MNDEITIISEVDKRIRDLQIHVNERCTSNGKL